MATSPAPFAPSPHDCSAHPAHIHPGYKATLLRRPKNPLLPIRQALADMAAPVRGVDQLRPLKHDLTRNAIKNGEPLGERLMVVGCVSDEDGRPVKNTLIDIWQDKPAGRCVLKADHHNAPLDPNLLGAGRCVTDSEGQNKFWSVKPGAYPRGNGPSAWRPNHIHLSLFGKYFASRLVTQMYFPGDPLLPFYPMDMGPPEKSRALMVARFSLDAPKPAFALGYVFDIVLHGPQPTRFE